MSLWQPPQLSEGAPDRTFEDPGDLLGDDQAVVLAPKPAPEPGRRDGDHALDGALVVDEVTPAGLAQPSPEQSPHRLPAPKLEVPDPGGHGLLVGGQANHSVVWKPLVDAGSTATECVGMGPSAAIAVDGRTVRLPVQAIEVVLRGEPFVAQQSALELLEYPAYGGPERSDSGVRHASLIRRSGWTAG